MAPSNVFSYLRPHHRRTHSHPSSPEPQLSTSSITNPAPLHDALNSTPTSASRFTSSDTSNSHASSPMSPFAPSLPTLSRVGRRSNPPDPQKYSSSTARDHGYSKRHSMMEDALQGSTTAGGRAQEQVKPSPDSAISPEGWRDLGTGRYAPTGLRIKGQSASNAAQNCPWPVHASSSTLAETAPTNASFTASQTSVASTTIPEKEKHSNANKTPGPSQSTKSGKRALNLLNPMSLLLRRRSAQALQSLSEESLVSHRNHVVPAMSLGDDFDPSIRGNIIHDFSAPKPRRTQSYDLYAIPQGRRKDNRDDESPSKRDRSHTPVFKEEFDAPEADEKKRESAIRAEELANHDFLARNAVPSESGQEQPFPPFGRHPAQPPLLSRISVPRPLDQMPAREDATGLAPVPEASPRSPDSDTKRSNATRTPPLSRSRATSAADSSNQSGLPTHMTSRASRFSFQIGGVDSAAQEKLLEEKHRERFAKTSKDQIGDEFGDAEDDMYDYANVDDDMGGFEEEIPTIGGDDDGFGEDERPGVSPGLSSLDFNSMVVGSHFDEVLGPVTGKTVGSPRTNGEEAQESSSRNEAGMEVGYNEHEAVDTGSNGIGGIRISLQPTEDLDVATGADKSSQFQENDDFYFDDGLMGEPDPPLEGEKFDESVFDDPEHHLYERRAPASKPLPTQRMDAMSQELHEDQTELLDEPTPAHALAPHPSVRGKQSAFQATEHFDFNSTSYHSALADAINKAEVDGRFVRKNSIATTDVSSPSAEDEGQDNGESADQTKKERDLQDSSSAYLSDSGRGSCQVDTVNSGFDNTGELDHPFNPDPYDIDFDDYGDYDIDLEDDPIIAAANAEALANDYDGEYGSEFGFYASAYGIGQAGPGGYFGPRGSDALGRSASGRYAVREPNLTPITERSEYSTRNSFIGLGHFAGPSSAPGSQAQNSAGAVPSPGFAQFARTSPYGFPPGTEDDFSDYEMSLEQLMRLRKGAFGAGSPAGSTASSPRNSSPMNFFPGSFSGRGSSPVATRTKSSLDTYAEGLEEVEESPDEASSTQAQASSASQSDANRVDLSPEPSSAGDDSPQHASAPVQIYGIPPQQHSGYDAFLPDHPGAIPVSVPASAISTNSTSSFTFSHPSAIHSAKNSTSGIAVSPALSVAAPVFSPAAGPTSYPQQPPPPYSPMDPQKHLSAQELDADQNPRSSLHIPLHQHTRTHSQPLPQVQPLLSPLYSPTPTNNTTTSTTSPSANGTSSTATTPANLSPQPPQCPTGFPQQQQHPTPPLSTAAAIAAAAAPPPYHRRGKSSGYIPSTPLAPTSQPQSHMPPMRSTHSRTNSANADHFTYVRERVFEDDTYSHNNHAPFTGGSAGGRPAMIASPEGGLGGGGEMTAGAGAGAGGDIRDGFFAADGHRHGVGAPPLKAKGADREVYRWVLERRRASGTTGEMELVGREVVEGGRI